MARRTGETRGRPKAHEGSPDELLAGAYRAFAAGGYHETSMDDIARITGVGHGTLYRYFGTKVGIFKRVVERAALRVAHLVAAETPASAHSLADYEAQLWRIGDRLSDLVDEEPDLVRFVEESQGVDPGVDRMVAAVLTAFAEFTAEYLTHGKQQKYLRADLDVPVTARLVNAMILETVRQLGLRAGKPARRQWMKALIRLLLEGIKS